MPTLEQLLAYLDSLILGDPFIRIDSVDFSGDV